METGDTDKHRRVGKSSLKSLDPLEVVLSDESETLCGGDPVTAISKRIPPPGWYNRAVTHSVCAPKTRIQG